MGGKSLRDHSKSALCAVILLSMFASLAVAAPLELRLGRHDFDWSAVEQERAHFRWSAEVINDTDRAFEVDVSIDLLDDDDRVVETDSTSVIVEPGETGRAQHEGSLPLDRAADVVSFRFRLAPRSPDGN